MSQSNGTRLLAVAVDACEPTFLRHLIEQDEMPALKALWNDGRWFSVKSPAYIGSGSVWPTFMTGKSPEAHGVYGEWLWQPDDMTISRYSGSDLKPFWKTMADTGTSVGVLDLPFMPVIGLKNGFEISEWGAHDLLACKTQIGPDSIAEIVSSAPPHPLQTKIQVSGPRDYQNLRNVGEACLSGITARGNLARTLIAETRPELVLIGFPEIHHAAHYLWQTAEPGHSIYQRASLHEPAIRPTMDDIFRELDRQISALVATVGPEASVIIFSLHGMRPALGVPTFLTHVLCEWGFARLGKWASQSWLDRMKVSLARLKRSTPPILKKLYYKVLPPTITHQLAQPTMLPLYDWTKTKAFALPTDQHGWIRINLRGREREGIVPIHEYNDICEQLKGLLLDLRLEDGELLVRDVIRTASESHAANSLKLPDLIVHWADGAFSENAKIKDSNVRTETTGHKFTGQHALDGFCLIKSQTDLWPGDALNASEIRLLIASLLT